MLAALELRQRLRAPDALRGQPHGVAPCLGLHSGPVVVGPLAYEPQRPYTATGDTLHLAAQLQQQATPDTILVSTATYALVQDEVQGEECQIPAPDGPCASTPVYAIRALLRRQAGVPRRGARPLSRFVGRTFAILRHIIRHASRRQPLLLAVENLHWIDPTSEEWLTSLVERLSDMSVLLLTTYRPGYQPSWLRHSVATQMALPRLSSRDSLVVLQSVPQAARLPASLQRTIVAKAAGNPFFVEELTWAAVAHGDYTFTLPVPDTLEAVLAARLDRLPPEAKRLVQTAAVIGPEIPLSLLQRVAGLPEDELQRSLAHLQATEFLYETQLFPDPVYSFKHALTHEVAYGCLLHERRRVLHARIVEVLEECSTDRLAEQVDRLAHHALRGEVWDKALGYCRQAGTKAVQHSAHREALACFEQALTALSHLPQDRATMEQAVDLRFERRPAFISLGEFDRLRDDMRAAAALAAALDDQRRLGWVSSFMAHYSWRTGDSSGAVTAGQSALRIARTQGDMPLQVTTETILGMAHWSRGDYTQTIRIARQLVRTTEGEVRYERFGLNSFASVLSRVFLTWCLGEQGAFVEAIGYGEEGLQIAEAVSHPDSFVRIAHGMGHLYLCQGKVPQALSVLERGLAVCQEANIPVMWPWLTAELSYAYALSGRDTEAIPLVDQAVERASAMKSMSFLSLWVGRLSAVYLLAGRSDTASSHAEHALALARTHQERGHEAWSLWLLGDITMSRDPSATERAEAYYRQALTLAEALDMRPLQAHCRRGLGLLSAKVGRPEQARADLAAAIDLYRAMDMAFWLPEAEAALAQAEGL